MAANHFSVRPEAVRAAGRRLRAESEALELSLAMVRSGMPGASSTFGDDEQGLAFAADYRPKADQLRRNVQDMVTALGRMADALEAMADNYEAADAASQASGR